jgi:hypothetical protein
MIPYFYKKGKSFFKKLEFPAKKGGMLYSARIHVDLRLPCSPPDRCQTALLSGGDFL